MLIVALAAAYVLTHYVPWSRLHSLAGQVRLPALTFLSTPTFTPAPTATRTRTRTVVPTPTSTQTPLPPTATATPLPPTATRKPVPTRTATPSLRFVAVHLTAPENKAEFRGSDAQISLTWEPAGTLAEDEWYALSLRYAADGVVRYNGTWTKDTSWLVPGDLYMKAGQTERTFQWDVAVMQQTGTNASGGRQGKTVSSLSETRAFVWY